MISIPTLLRRFGWKSMLRSLVDLLDHTPDRIHALRFEVPLLALRSSTLFPRFPQMRSSWRSSANWNLLERQLEPEERQLEPEGKF